MTDQQEPVVVAVVDDEQEQAETVADVVVDAGLVPAIITECDGLFQDTQDLMQLLVGRGCSALVCDHRLNQRPFAAFDGAKLVAEAFRASIPGILLSTFASVDAPASIRLHRAYIPSMMPREDLDPNRLNDGLLLCRREIAGFVAPEREPWKVMVRVVRVVMDAEEPMVWAVMHTWDPDREVQFPLELIGDPQIRRLLPVGFNGEVRLFADVNVECIDEDDLFFKGFEPAPNPEDFEFTTQSVDR